MGGTRRNGEEGKKGRSQEEEEDEEGEGEVEEERGCISHLPIMVTVVDIPVRNIASFLFALCVYCACIGKEVSRGTGVCFRGIVEGVTQHPEGADALITPGHHAGHGRKCVCCLVVTY